MKEMIVNIEAIRSASRVECNKDGYSETLGSNEKYFKRSANNNKITRTAIVNMTLDSLGMVERKDKMRFLSATSGRNISSTKDLRLGEYEIIKRAKASGILENAVNEYRALRRKHLDEIKKEEADERVEQ